MSDFDLVTAFVKGSLEAFNEIYNRYELKVYNRAYQIVSCPFDADDVTQNTFTQIHQKIYTFKGDSKFSSWLYRVTSNEALLIKREQRKQIKVLNAAEFISETAQDISLKTSEYSHELRKLISQSYHELSENYRKVFFLKVIEDLSFPQIATLLGIEPNAAKLRFHRAKIDMQKTLRRKYGKAFNGIEL